MTKVKIFHDRTQVKKDRSMKTIRQLLKISILVTVIVLVSVGTSQAFNPQPEPPGSVAVGITTSQTAWLSVVLPPDPFHPPDPCRVRLSLFDAEGNVLRVMEDTVRPGQVISLGLSGAELGLRAGERMQIYAQVEACGPLKGKRRVKIKAGLELFDNETGMTIVVVPVATTLLRSPGLDR